jgi:hypothetical protein
MSGSNPLRRCTSLPSRSPRCCRSLQRRFTGSSRPTPACRPRGSAEPCASVRTSSSAGLPRGRSGAGGRSLITGAGQPPRTLPQRRRGLAPALCPSATTRAPSASAIRVEPLSRPEGQPPIAVAAARSRGRSPPPVVPRMPGQLASGGPMGVHPQNRADSPRVGSASSIGTGKRGPLGGLTDERFPLLAERPRPAAHAVHLASEEITWYLPTSNTPRQSACGHSQAATASSRITRAGRSSPGGPHRGS